MSLTGGNSGPVINSAIRTVGVVAPGSASARYGANGAFNIDAAAPSGVADAVNHNRWRTNLYGRSGIDGGLAHAAGFLGGLYPSQSLPPNGVQGGAGAGSVNSGGPAKSTGGAGPQNTTSTNPNHNGLSPAQVSALNQQNKLPPELLAQLIADKTNKTEARRNPELKEQGKPTADPKLNEALEKLGSNIKKKIESFDKKLEKIFESMNDEQFKDEFKDSGFDTKQELLDFNAQMKKEVLGGHFNQETYDKFSKFLGSIPDKLEYKELKAEGNEIKDLYKKGLDATQNEYVKGNFISAAEEITKGDPKEDVPSFLDSFLDQAGVKRDESGKPQFTEGQKDIESFYNLAKDSVNEAQSKFTDGETGAKGFDNYLQKGQFNDNITEMKRLYEGFQEGFKANLNEGDKNYAKETMNNMMFMKASSPSSHHAANMEAGIRDIQKQNPGKELTRDDVLKNKTMEQNFFQPYYDEAFKDLPEPDNKFKREDEVDSPDSGSSSTSNQRSAEDAVASLDSSVSFGDDYDDLVAKVDEPDIDLDLDLDLDDIDIDFD
jgi:hypothetical protein